jgi:hypothetical protein
MTATRSRLLERDSRGRPTFVYVPSSQTDIRATFKRVREQMQQPAQAPNVKQLRGRHG